MAPPYSFSVITTKPLEIFFWKSLTFPYLVWGSRSWFQKILYCCCSCCSCSTFCEYKAGKSNKLNNLGNSAFIITKLHTQGLFDILNRSKMILLLQLQPYSCSTAAAAAATNWIILDISSFIFTKSGIYKYFDILIWFKKVLLLQLQYSSCSCSTFFKYKAGN